MDADDEDAGGVVEVRAAIEAEVMAEADVAVEADVVAAIAADAEVAIEAGVAASVEADVDVPTGAELAVLLADVTGAAEGLDIDPTAEDGVAEVADLVEAPPVDPSCGTVTTTRPPEGDATRVESVTDVGEDELDDAPEVARVQPPTAANTSAPISRIRTSAEGQRGSGRLRRMPLSYTSTPGNSGKPAVTFGGTCGGT